MKFRGKLSPIKFAQFCVKFLGYFNTKLATAEKIFKFHIIWSHAAAATDDDCCY
jgi:hypothetical protein